MTIATANKGNMWLVIVVVIALLAGGVYYFSTREAAPVAEENTENTATTTETGTEMAGMSVVPEGEYTVVPTESRFTWEAKKPLIEGYINSGTIALKEGMIEVGTSTAMGDFTVDMTTLKVGLTATKPGKESALEAHLKSKDFFEVEKYPATTFVITSVTPMSDSSTTFVYTVTGDLTMKGKKNPITFPAKIYLKEGKLHADATVEVDRTKWGITYGSGSFFDNLADNAISDTFALTFALVAERSVPTSSGTPEVQ